jgi:hypothetical protein
VLQLLLEAASEYYDGPSEQPSINVRWDKQKTVFVVKMFLDVGEDEHSCVTQAEGKTPDEAIMRLAEAWAKIKFEGNAIKRFLETLRGRNQ